MKRARLVKRAEQQEETKNNSTPVAKSALVSFNREIVRQWIDERKTKSVTDPRQAFSALFA